MIDLSQYWKGWFLPLAIVAGSVVLALIVHAIVFSIGRRLAARTGSVVNASLVRHAEGPTRWIFPLIAIMLAMPALPLQSDWVDVLRRIVGLGVIAAIAWAIILLSDVFGDTLYSRYRIDVSDNLTARHVRTRIAVLQRIFSLVVIVVALSIMLMTFPAIHQIGASLLASAGLAGLVVGVSMRPTLASLIAGLQIALTEPIRIEDVVIVEGEYGWIEEILTTYVVVRTWDLRRLIVPLSYFIEHVFQNWTRRSADLLSYVFLYCDYTVPVDELRQEFRRVLEASPLWDKKVCVLQVTDATPQSVQIRALASAADSAQSFNLQVLVRESLITFLQREYPGSLPKVRAEIDGRPADKAQAKLPLGEAVHQ